jgi:hypothetical protein
MTARVGVPSARQFERTAIRGGIIQWRYECLCTVKSDGTSQFIDADGSVFGEVVSVADGEEVYFMSLTDGNTVAGVMKRISPQKLN